jgi:hypothetical protein
MDGAGLLFECAERSVLRVLAEPPRPAEANEFAVHASTILQRHIGEPSAVDISAVIADGDDVICDETTQRSLGLLSEPLAPLGCLDPMQADDNLRGHRGSL